MFEVLCPKYYVQSLSEVWLLKTEFWSLKLLARFKTAEKKTYAKKIQLICHSKKIT